MLFVFVWRDFLLLNSVVSVVAISAIYHFIQSQNYKNNAQGMSKVSHPTSLLYQSGSFNAIERLSAFNSFHYHAYKTLDP